MSPRNEQIQRNYSRRALRTSRFVNQNQNQNRNSQIINSNTIDRIARITTPQITDNLFANDLFNGTNFHNDSNPESLILPSGSSENLLLALHSPLRRGGYISSTYSDIVPSIIFGLIPSQIFKERSKP
ncbi:hypothetical protein RhiirA5_410409 [Rhizophagus irregularis]|uniref:Uncharacterized protein n=1 Tax=Rhizophagus irregularis TaxID=588596 RepID=A0A2I1EB83_9GLOM|nr:hypothetical protein RhiirA5_410409 [Rhizophagus irregularis]PKC62561.1 hypothetical protein RhiirA1_464972 [Rhizophagus irregularis]PKY19372.1 hypothetical protein RhiirB3_432410 [Rhizophagus irregularis]